MCLRELECPLSPGERPQILPIARLKPRNGSDTLRVLDFRDRILFCTHKYFYEDEFLYKKMPRFGGAVCEYFCV